MAGFASLDDFTNQITVNGKTWRQDWNKNMLPTTAAVAGEWSFLARGAGNPGADSLFNTGTNLLQQHVYDAIAAASSIQHGGNVAADGDGWKHIVNASSFSASATTMPAILMLVDLLGFVRLTSVTTTTAQNVINSNTFTASSSSGLLLTYTNDFPTFTMVRFTTTGTLPAGLSLNTDYWLVRQSGTTSKVATSLGNAIAGTVVAFTDSGTGTHTLKVRHPRYGNGAGVQAFMWNNNATALGAATPNLSIGYTNSAGVASRATPTTLPIGKTAAANGLVLYSGTGSGKYGPFLPLQGGDAGIQSIETIQCATSYVSGEFSVGLCKPLLTLPMTTIGVAAERDLMNQVPSLPRVYDGAALFWMIYHGANTPVNSAFYGHLDFAWS
ncbi:MAG: hypothetical protein JNK15_23760 [Planctomycetes bacterium]|nr:hypothetical protein [Planctomycetota bacterium]